VTEGDILDALNKLLPAQFEALLLRAEVPHEILSSATAPQGIRATELIQWMRQHDLHRARVEAGLKQVQRASQADCRRALALETGHFGAFAQQMLGWFRHGVLMRPHDHAAREPKDALAAWAIGLFVALALHTVDLLTWGGHSLLGNWAIVGMLVLFGLCLLAFAGLMLAILRILGCRANWVDILICSCYAFAGFVPVYYLSVVFSGQFHRAVVLLLTYGDPSQAYLHEAMSQMLESREVPVRLRAIAAYAWQVAALLYYFLVALPRAMAERVPTMGRWRVTVTCALSAYFTGWVGAYFGAHYWGLISRLSRGQP
jgi:hypothetical protein